MTTTPATDLPPTTPAAPVSRPLAGYAAFAKVGRQNRLTLSEAGVAIVRKPTLSPSTASAVASCGARFAVERLVDKLDPQPPDPLGAAELGTAGHQVFEDLFARPKGERGLSATAELLERLETDHPELGAPVDPELRASWRDAVQRRVLGFSTRSSTPTTSTSSPASST